MQHFIWPDTKGEMSHFFALLWDLRVGACRALSKLEQATRVAQKPSTLRSQAAQKRVSCEPGWWLEMLAMHSAGGLAASRESIHLSWNVYETWPEKGRQTKTLLNLLGALHSSTFLGAALRQRWLTAVSWDRNGAAAPSSWAGWRQ